MLAVALVPYALLARALWFLCDDAFIAFRYARHLAEGHGLRFNLGEHVPVEGFSDLLWVLAAAGVEAAGHDVAVVLPWVSASVGLLGLALAYGFARREGASAQAASAAVAAASALPMFGAWATSGLETMAHAVLVLACVGVALAPEGRERPATLAVLVGLLALLRVEGVLWGGAVLALAWGVRPGARRALWGPALTLGVVLLGLSGLRLAVFGEVIPNVVKVKGGLSVPGGLRGLVYVALAAVTFPGVLAGVVAAWRAAGERRRETPWAWAALGVCGWAVVVGGDYMPFFRFLVPAVPLLAVVAALALDRLPAGRALGVVVGAIALDLLPMVPLQLVPEPVLLAGQQIVGTKSGKYVPELVAWQRERDKVPFRRAKARALLEVAEPGDIVVARGVGALGYETELFILDQYGLVTREVAEEAPTVLRAPGHDHRLQRGAFLGYTPDFLFVIGLRGERKDEVIDLLPRQWGVFEELGDGMVYVADLHTVRAELGPAAPRHLLLVRLLRDGEDPGALRERFKAQVRDAGYVAPRLLPLDDRRREVALEKRRGGEHLMEVLWGPRGVPRRSDR